MKKVVLSIIAILGLGMLLLSSCDNNPGPGTAEIKVINSDGVAQKRVKVVLFCTESNCVVRREGHTNDLGVYSQEFDLPVVLRVRSVRYDTTITLVGLEPFQVKKVTLDSLCGEGFVQVDYDEVSNEIVTILECN